MVNWRTSNPNPWLLVKADKMQLVALGNYGLHSLSLQVMTSSHRDAHYFGLLTAKSERIKVAEGARAGQDQAQVWLGYEQPLEGAARYPRYP